MIKCMILDDQMHDAWWLNALCLMIKCTTIPPLLRLGGIIMFIFIKCHQASSSVIKHHQASSSVIKHLQALSSVIMHYYLSAMSSKMPSDCNCSELAVSWLCFGSVSSLKRSCKSIKPDIRSMVLLYVSSIANSLLQNGQWHAGSCQYQTVVKYQRNFILELG